MATGLVSMAPVPPSVVYSASSASPHILPKHTSAPSAITHLHPQPHPDRQVERHPPPDRSAERQSDRQTDVLAHSDRQVERQTAAGNSNSPAAPPSGAAVSVRPCSPPLQIQAPGRTARSTQHQTWKIYFCFVKKCLCGSQAAHPSYRIFPSGSLRK